MENRLFILGSGSAKPTKDRQPTAQVLEMAGKQFLIDCGEGAQLAIARMNIHTPRLDHIFISHLHGDHCFGLIGLLSTWGMTGRTRTVTIHSPAALERLLRPLLDFFCQGMAYEVCFEPFSTTRPSLIYEDKTLTVSTLPLKHKVPCCGFLFAEKKHEPHIRKEMIEALHIPLAEIPHIKAGGDYLAADGRLYQHAELTLPAAEPFRYAYCSDTAFSERLTEWIQGVDWLYHEATFSEEYASRCKQTGHSTAREAAFIARLANVKHLLIGHFSSRIQNEALMLQEAKEVFENTTAVHDGEVIRLTHSISHR